MKVLTAEKHMHMQTSTQTREEALTRILTVQTLSQHKDTIVATEHSDQKSNSE